MNKETRKIVAVDIQSAKRIELLNDFITRGLRVGWELLGDLIVTPLLDGGAHKALYTQKMVKYENVKTETKEEGEKYWFIGYKQTKLGLTTVSEKFENAVVTVHPIYWITEFNKVNHLDRRVLLFMEEITEEQAMKLSKNLLGE